MAVGKDISIGKLSQLMEIENSALSIEQIAATFKKAEELLAFIFIVPVPHCTGEHIRFYELMLQIHTKFIVF